MSKWGIYTPEGVQDILFEECQIKRSIESKIRNLFVSSGFCEVETPTLEFYDVFSHEAGQTPQETMFKFFDPRGRILVLRPEITIPIARITATKYKDAQYPLRFSYIGNAFKFNEMGGGKQKEFTQAGVEVIGVSGPEADAEVIATAINSVRAAGLENFQVDLGQVEFFKGIMEETGLSQEEIEQVRVLIDRKDFLGVEELVESHSISQELKELILGLPALFGSIDVIEKLEQRKLNKRAMDALANLREVLSILEDYGLSKYVSVDLGMINSLDYYSGIIFRGFTYGIGFPILSGGRYDHLVEKFGKPSPATGFSLGINMVMTALDRQKIEGEKQSVDSLICYAREGRKTAFKVCEELRRQGLMVELDITRSGLEAVKQYAVSKGIGGIFFIADDDRIEIHNLESGEVVETRFSELIKTMEG